MDLSHPARTEFYEALPGLLPSLRGFARSLTRSSRYEYEDLVNDTVANALRSIHHYQPGTSLRSWLFTIMRHTFCTKVNREKRIVLGNDDCCSARAISPALQEWHVQGREIERAISHLSPNHRQIVQDILLDGISYKIAGRRAGCNIGTVKSRYNRAREKLMAELSPTH